MSREYIEIFMDSKIDELATFFVREVHLCQILSLYRICMFFSSYSFGLKAQKFLWHWGASTSRNQFQF